jgi:quinol monooxygenase YgiN
MTDRSTVTVFATFHPIQGHEQQVRSILADMIGSTRAEDGNLTYDLYVSEDEGRQVFHLFERYRDQQALQAHRDAPYFKAYRAAIPDHLDAPIGVVVMDAVDVAG